MWRKGRVVTRPSPLPRPIALPKVSGAGRGHASRANSRDCPRLPCCRWACACEFSRQYDPFEDPQGTVWTLVSADQVPEGAETAPLAVPESGTPVSDEELVAATPEASPAGT